MARRIKACLDPHQAQVEIPGRVREIDPAFPVIYISGISAADWPSKGVPHSIMLAKPFAPAQLVTAISNLINNATPTE
jgi:two-component SAPR family response regulator